MNRLIMVLVVVVAAGAGFAGYEWYLQNTGELEHFRVAYQQPGQGQPIKTVMLGRISERAGWDKAAAKLESDLLGSCSECEILETGRLDELSPKQTSLFRNETMPFNYISIDTDNRNQSDVRMLFPSLGAQYTTRACESSAQSMRESMGRDNIRCITASE